MKKFVFQAVGLLVITGVAFYLLTTGSLNNMFSGTLSSQGKQIVINNNRIKIELADTQAKRKTGLGGREALASDEGMLFIFEDSGKHPFWMKGMKIALDLIWISGDKVVDVMGNIAPPTAGQSDVALPIYQTKEPADRVLEVNAGTAQNLNIKVGDTVKIE